MDAYVMITDDVQTYCRSSPATGCYCRNRQLYNSTRRCLFNILR